MFLKSIEVRGFKSFADKIDIEFTKGTTAIVGPNGSGKSNISDAVRWVLGEQSVKSLRGGKMEDVIFSGTEYRKPLGLAQVSLTLDNSDGDLELDYSDVTISRRLYRSGESEYYINNTKSRLKDIQELFMDTGVGKEGYSIIGQGKIEAVLNGNPEERRGLLEEAAGIVKFKTRKKEAEKKLENTEQNIVRINDILKTYEERLEPLELESKKAKEFLDLSKDLKTKEINVIINDVEDVTKKIQEINSSLSEVNCDIEKIKTKKEECKNKLQHWNNKNEEYEIKLSSNKKEYYIKKDELQNIVSENRVLSERIKNINEFIEKTKEEIIKNKGIIDKLFDTKKNDSGILKENINKSNTLKINIDEFEKNINDVTNNISKRIEKLQVLKNEEIKNNEKIIEYKNSYGILKNNIATLKEKQEQIKGAVDGYINSIKINSTTENILQKEISKIYDKINNYQNEIKINKKEISKENKNLFSLEKELKIFTADYNKEQAKKSMLINLEKQYEGYNKSVKRLMIDIDKGRIMQNINKCFVLGEIIKVEKKLEIAIEISLGSSISNVITENETDAKFLIKHLKSNNLGRATFLPLNIIRGSKKDIPSDVSNIDGYVGIASDLIDYDNKFVKAIEYVLGRTLIARDMDSALKISKRGNYRYRIVTLSGEVVNPGGSLTGGSIFNRSSNIIGRKTKIEEIGTNIEKLKEAIEKKSQDIIQKRKIIKNLDEECLNLKDDIHSETIEIAKIKERIASIKKDTNNLSKSLSQAKEQISKINKEIEISNEKTKHNDNRINELQIELDAIKAKIKNIENESKEKNEYLLSSKDKITTFKIEKAKIDEIISNKREEQKRIENDILSLKEKDRELKEELENSIKNKEKNIEVIEKNKSNEKDIKEYLFKMEEFFKENEIGRIEIKNNIKKYIEKLDFISISLTKKEEIKHKQEISYTKFNTEVENMYRKLNEELDLTLAEALQYKIENMDIDKIKKEITELKIEISKLGTVNVAAIEEYKEVKEKYHFMNNQREDLINAKEELLSVIEEMTDKMKKVFNENFKKLKYNFNETFKELFKGGSADLYLNGEDVLTATIEINVQPPGKKLQNINLMSGGEKGLSAIALLFAILKMKPSPFCILDEIEAALDDANVARYAQFLNKFSSNTQFIVITHRKGTMEASDVLYGVTMEEKGVSKIVSVDLTK